MISLIFILNLFTCVVTAPMYPVAYITSREPLKYQRLLHAIIQIESRGDPDAINWDEHAMGLLQIRPIMIEEANRILRLQGKTQSCTLTDALDSMKSIQIYWIVQNFHNPSNDVKIGCRVWNGKSVKNKYYKKIQAQLWQN